MTSAQQPSNGRRHACGRPGPAGPYADTLARVAAGDGGALAALYDDFAEVVLSLARQQLHRAADAGPLTDAVFLELRWLAATPPPTTRGVLAWILDIAHRRIHDRNRPPATHRSLLDYDAHIHQELGTFLNRGAAGGGARR